MKIKFIILLITMTSLQHLHSQDTIKSCNEDSIHCLLDFWIGKWNVYDTSGSIIGTNNIEKILNGCAVMENWKDTDGSEGKSLFYVDNFSNKWKQVWVTDIANYPFGQKEKELVSFGSDSVIFMGRINYNGKIILDRTILSKENDGSVIQIIQLSRNNAESWKTVFKGIYIKNENKSK